MRQNYYVRRVPLEQGMSTVYLIKLLNRLNIETGIMNAQLNHLPSGLFQLQIFMNRDDDGN